MDEACVNIILIILGSISSLGTAFLVWKACQKPKARFRFADGKKEITLSPHYYNETLKYYVVPYPDLSQFDKYHDLGERYQKLHEKDNRFLLSFRLSNTGAFQLENYRVEIEYDKNQCSAYQIKEHHRGEPFIDLPTFDGVNFSDGKVILAPVGVMSALNQNDHDDYSFQITPKMDVERIELNWRIIAKDFSDKGKFVIHLKPTVTHYTNIKPVYRDCEVPEGEEKVDDLTPYIKEFEELLKE